MHLNKSPYYEQNGNHINFVDNFVSNLFENTFTKPSKSCELITINKSNKTINDKIKIEKNDVINSDIIRKINVKKLEPYNNTNILSKPFEESFTPKRKIKSSLKFKNILSNYYNILNEDKKKEKRNDLKFGHKYKSGVVLSKQSHNIENVEEERILKKIKNINNNKNFNLFNFFKKIKKVSETILKTNQICHSNSNYEEEKTQSECIEYISTKLYCNQNENKFFYDDIIICNVKNKRKNVRLLGYEKRKLNISGKKNSLFLYPYNQINITPSKIINLQNKCVYTIPLSYVNYSYISNISITSYFKNSCKNAKLHNLCRNFVKSNNVIKNHIKKRLKFNKVKNYYSKDNIDEKDFPQKNDASNIKNVCEYRKYEIPQMKNIANNVYSFQSYFVNNCFNEKNKKFQILEKKCNPNIVIIKHDNKNRKPKIYWVQRTFFKGWEKKNYNKIQKYEQNIRLCCISGLREKCRNGIIYQIVKNKCTYTIEEINRGRMKMDMFEKVTHNNIRKERQNMSNIQKNMQIFHHEITIDNTDKDINQYISDKNGYKQKNEHPLVIAKDKFKYGKPNNKQQNIDFNELNNASTYSGNQIMYYYSKKNDTHLNYIIKNNNAQNQISSRDCRIFENGQKCNEILEYNDKEIKKVNNYSHNEFKKKKYLIEWYPGFNVPIGTYGRAILRKALHQKRMTNIKKCDELLSSNNLFPTSRSTFGDMKIRDLYRAAYILDVWDIAEKYCLLACERNGYKREWISMLKQNNKKITIKALKEIRNKHIAKNKQSKSLNRKMEKERKTNEQGNSKNVKLKESYHIYNSLTHTNNLLMTKKENIDSVISNYICMPNNIDNKMNKVKNFPVQFSRENKCSTSYKMDIIKSQYIKQNIMENEKKNNLISVVCSSNIQEGKKTENNHQSIITNSSVLLSQKIEQINNNFNMDIHKRNNEDIKKDYQISKNFINILPNKINHKKNNHMMDNQFITLVMQNKVCQINYNADINSLNTKNIYSQKYQKKCIQKDELKNVDPRIIPSNIIYDKNHRYYYYYMNGTECESYGMKQLIYQAKTQINKYGIHDNCKMRSENFNSAFNMPPPFSSPNNDCYTSVQAYAKIANPFKNMNPNICNTINDRNNHNQTEFQINAYNTKSCNDQNNIVYHKTWKEYFNTDIQSKYI
ncbi:conserved Plasmodium protein, unknown function [Plasmodium vinckei vinckei]|uniref:Uncharacterized protein n=1 Tax=Plasmodium vinckei vinckei TaxID=54757 RepID=A0A449BY20_PLAVN|nr:conserved Plasmodium protein, unknown function [Plasmodium vinckei vinckei]KEG04681.1 hypothetical protein YYE_00256 [Plasmodium vinckei vinckei]VEV58333.1 conserved Plasmodium protein, unknown function [Plasmodium vinckei vinckei]